MRSDNPKSLLKECVHRVIHLTFFKKDSAGGDPHLIHFLNRPKKISFFIKKSHTDECILIS
ncbi:hypothetical protein LEP1GSC043_4774 [Leptospira weilii str. Ecochallenge]|uniref:Uncharacterized protein n=3 Tax=Leptospira weilii TaxID=28184 RepID=N1U635_9LEPT|nr:hypothetical protein LEP1GSC038_0467 [Leptospira weilii str. 2006001855]EMN91554.1 hypothetical protein LEP1GSC108_4058 [Leptospira weilii str. UI 13098]EMY13616.1 hypothetical protein LEP1GSC043_4774 [Leptospira weilii str. Ecochallenge]OMI16642.1 hypothetical protein BUQ74_14590 [Leptospira weilii serovar Heyan]